MRFVLCLQKKNISFVEFVGRCEIWRITVFTRKFVDTLLVVQNVQMWLSKERMSAWLVLFSMIACIVLLDAFCLLLCYYCPGIKQNPFRFELSNFCQTEPGPTDNYFGMFYFRMFTKHKLIIFALVYPATQVNDY